MLLLTGTKPKGAHVHFHFRELYWLIVCFHAQFEILAVTYKAIYKQGSGYLKGPLAHLESAHWLRFSGAVELRPSPQIWNSLPREARQVLSLHPFRQYMVTEIFSRAFYSCCLAVTVF